MKEKRPHKGSHMIQHKDTENHMTTQAILAKAVVDSFFEHIFDECEQKVFRLGEGDKNVNRDHEGTLCKNFHNAVCSYRSPEGFPLVRYESGDVLRVYNQGYFTPIDCSEFECGIGKTLELLEVGNAYIVRSDKVITEFIMKRLRHEPEFEYNPDPTLLALKNGIYDIKSGMLLSPSPQFQPRFRIDLPLLKEDCPLLLRILNEDLDPEVIPVLQEALGSILGGPHLEKLPLLVGSGRNGKSLILNAFIELLGRENVTGFSLSQITDSSGTKIPPMMNKLANICTDSGAFIGRGNEGILKAYVSGEALMAKPLYRQPFLTTNYPRSIIALNEFPASSDLSEGWFRRFLIVPFTRQIPEDKVDPTLGDQLRAEYPGILAWILAGTRRIYEQGHFSDSVIVREAQEAYRTEADTVRQFIDEKEIIATENMTVKVAHAYRNYSEWCKESGYLPIGKRKFSNRLRALHIKIAKKGGDMTAYMGNPFSEI